MSDIRDLALDASKAILEENCTTEVVSAAHAGTFPAALWRQLEEAGLTRALAPEVLGGSALSIPDAGALIRQSAYYAAPVPLCEAMLAGWLLGMAGVELPGGVATLAVVPQDGSCRLEAAGNAWRVYGSVSAVPWASAAANVVLVFARGAGIAIALVSAGSYAASPGINLAAEPRETIALDGAPAVVHELHDISHDMVHELGAAMRAAQMAGALQRALELSVTYTMERKQFGRPLSKFQAVQNNLSILAGQAAAANGAAEIALGAATRPGATVAIAAAKARANEAATTGAALAHQVHGAMGLTQEYLLHHYTQRLWAWRDEFGGESYWWSRLGEIALKDGADGYWRTVCEVDLLVAGNS